MVLSSNPKIPVLNPREQPGSARIPGASAEGVEIRKFEGLERGVRSRRTYRYGFAIATEGQEF